DQFFKKASVVNFEIEDKQPTALSLCDQSTLRWAIDNDINWLLADERLLRRVAVEEGISVIGFLGLLTGAAFRKHITANKARELVDEAVSKHGCRISIAVYQRVMEELDKF
ncbi:MAG: hypothetical protein GXP30_12255, partial [Verrucomicrobia bacterium]|nr:hypothetical protein [Verrucomicrobiota bacterium]